jgi:hypothetical protein
MGLLILFFNSPHSSFQTKKYASLTHASDLVATATAQQRNSTTAAAAAASATAATAATTATVTATMSDSEYPLNHNACSNNPNN